jgi:hypothetical protein
MNFPAIPDTGLGARKLFISTHDNDTGKYLKSKFPEAIRKVGNVNFRTPA